MCSTSRVYLLIGALLVLSHLSLSTVAAPVTYQFQATVRPLAPGVGDVDLPFTLEEGSVIDGLLTIDSDLGVPFGINASDSVQPFEIALSYEGFSFGAEMYSTRVVNDSPVFDNPVFSVADFVTFSCSTGLAVPCSPELVEFPNLPPLLFAMRTSFAGDISLLAEPKLPYDVDVWNAFTFERSMVFSFATNDGVGDSFGTTLSSFTVLPEPLSAYSFLIYWLLLLARPRQTRSYFSQN